jgi:hypothetical protein
MTEGEVVEQLVEFTNMLLISVSVIFTVVSAYVVALNYFIGSANLFARLMTFIFVSIILGMLVFAMMGAVELHHGLIDRLHEIEAAGELTAAGRAALMNAAPDSGIAPYLNRSVDELVRLSIWIGLAFVYLSLAYLTFVHRWRPDAIPVAVTRKTA